MDRAVETPSLGIVFAGSGIAGVSWYCGAAPPEVPKLYDIGGEGVVCGWRRLSCRRLSSAVCDLGTTWRVSAWIWIIMIQKAGVKNKSILGFGRSGGRGNKEEELT